MAQRKQSSSKQRAQGGGRTPNSEPRVQVFKGFNGMDFEHSPALELNDDWRADPDQEDLIMTKVAFQNNVGVTNNLTLETTPDLIKLGVSVPSSFIDSYCQAKGFQTDGVYHVLTGPACLVGSYLFLAFGLHIPSSGKDLIEGFLGKVRLGSESSVMDVIEFQRNSFEDPSPITHIYWAQERLVVCDTKGQVWRSVAPVHVTEDDDPGSLVSKMYGAISIPDPAQMTMSNLTVHGSLRLSQSYDADNYPYRISVAYCIDTMFGPTKASKPLVLYASIEVAEWNESNYLTANVTIPSSQVNEFGAVAASLYYTVDDAYELQFAQRAEFSGNVATIDWYGYLTDTTMWTIANLDAPTTNYTMGPAAQYCIMIDGRLYFWGGSSTGVVSKDDLAPDYRIIIGGNPGNLFSSSPATGGGFVDIEPGTGKFVNSIVKYKTQSGSNIVTALCGSRQSQEELRYNLVSTTVSLSQDNSTNSWNAEHVSGSVGCRGPLGALVCEDGLYTVNRYGLALTTMTMEYNNQIRTTYVSDPIKPVFLADDDFDKMVEYLIHCDGVIYYGKADKVVPEYSDRSVVFCYDVNVKAWWSISIPAIAYNAVHIDSKRHAEGVGFICNNDVYVLPTTMQAPDYGDQVSLSNVVETANISTTQPNHGYHNLTQLEFDFDRFMGTMLIEVIGIDIFGRKVKASKIVSVDSVRYGLEVYMRIDLKLKEYKIRMSGDCDYRLTCILAKLYVMSSKVGIVWGFDDNKTFRSKSDIQAVFKSYNDVVESVIP